MARHRDKSLERLGVQAESSEEEQQTNHKKHTHSGSGRRRSRNERYRDHQHHRGIALRSSVRPLEYCGSVGGGVVRRYVCRRCRSGVGEAPWQNQREVVKGALVGWGGEREERGEIDRGERDRGEGG